MGELLNIWSERLCWNMVDIASIKPGFAFSIHATSAESLHLRNQPRDRPVGTTISTLNGLPNRSIYGFQADPMGQEAGVLNRGNPGYGYTGPSICGKELFGNVVSPPTKRQWH